MANSSEASPKPVWKKEENWCQEGHPAIKSRTKIPKMLVTRESRQPLARVYPVRDTQAHRPTTVENWRGLLSHRWARLKKIVDRKIRIGSLNVGTMTAKSNDLVDIMKR